jgi:hypothetical protein
MERELLACPYCGGKPHMWGIGSTIWIGCENDCVETHIHPTDQAATDIWNRRAETPEAAELAALKAEIAAGKLVRLPVAIGETVFVVSRCEYIQKRCDNDYFTGTGAIECPYDSQCESDECRDDNRRAFETNVRAAYVDEDGGVECFVDDLSIGVKLSDVGKMVFYTKAEAEAALAAEQEGQDG